MSLSVPLPPPEDAARDLVGYLNFATGKRDGRLFANVARLWTDGPEDHPHKAEAFRERLLAEMETLAGTSAAFNDLEQARRVTTATFDQVLPAYITHQADLLAHLPRETFHEPFLLARLLEATLQTVAEDGWDGVPEGAVRRLNDFLGYRPVAVLENGRKSLPYEHESHAPLPVFVADAGVAPGRYHDLVLAALQLLADSPIELLIDSYFEFERLDEVAVDLRAHDHLHPMYKRTNCMFGEWDGSTIDTKGEYRRFILRRIILESLQSWLDNDEIGFDRDERLFDAAAALAGTILMASTISGAGPGTHDSTVSLTSLLPVVARRRDEFYERLIADASGARARRLKELAEATRQPFGHIRQHVNMTLARFGARQVQNRELARLYARIGFPEAARATASQLPAVSARFECELQCRIGTVHRRVDAGDVDGAAEILPELTSLVHRGIACGGLVDPWNILGFAGQFPVFQAREDTIPDPRVEVLLILMEGLFNAMTRVLVEAAAQDHPSRAAISEQFRSLAEWWDRFGSETIEDLPDVVGLEAWESATHVADVLVQWRQAGEATGDVSFWREHVDQFESAHAYAPVVEALLERRDFVASMGLLMQWLSQIDDVGAESSRQTIFGSLQRWVGLLTNTDTHGIVGDDRAQLLRRMFAFLEANAEDSWGVPQLDLSPDGDESLAGDELGSGDEPGGTVGAGGAGEADWLDQFDEDDESGDGLFSAAYEDVTYRDSTDDGNFGDTLDDGGYGGPETEFEVVSRRLEPRLKFLHTVGQMWQNAAVTLLVDQARPAETGGGTDDAAKDDGQQNAAPGETTEDREPTASGHSTDAEGEAAEPTVAGDATDEPSRPVPPAPPSVAAAADRLEPPISPELEAALAEWHQTSSGWETELVSLLGNVCAQSIDAIAGDQEANIEYDTQFQAKNFLVHQIIVTLVCLRNASRLLQAARRSNAGVDDDATPPQSQRFERRLTAIYRAVLQDDREALAQQLPTLLSRLEKRALLYVPIENGGEPRQVLRVQTLQSVLRWLLRELPRRGMLRETWHLLRTAARMERNTRPSGPAITEFDRLFETALRESLRTLLESAATWEHGSPAAIAALVGDVTEHYHDRWLRHSRTMRLSAVDHLRLEGEVERIESFVKRYGGELFHASQLTLSHVRAILHHGIDWYLNYLAEFDDPLHPLKLLEDLEAGVISRDEVSQSLELIYSIIVDKYDRFLEYNTTTTQSDYGEKLYALFDFLTLEAEYDREEWNLTPLVVAHEAIVRAGQREAAGIWQDDFSRRTIEKATKYPRLLAERERREGMRMPSISDHLGERFVKPLAVNRMLADVEAAVRLRGASDEATLAERQEIFDRLTREIDDYMADTDGSGVDVPDWLQDLHDEAEVAEAALDPADDEEAGVRSPRQRLSRAELQAQLAVWTDPLDEA